MFCWKTKSKLKLSLATFTILFGIFKFVQFSFYTYSICKVISDEDCSESCVVEYSELAFIISILIPLSLLVYGASKVKSETIVVGRGSSKFTFQLSQSCIGLWLVAHVLLLAFHLYVQYEIRLSPESHEYSLSTVATKSIEFSE
jgi:hypothetical protein